MEFITNFANVFYWLALLLRHFTIGLSTLEIGIVENMAMCLFSIKTVTLSLLNIDLMKNVSQLCSSEMIGVLVKNPVVEMLFLYLIPYIRYMEYGYIKII